MLSDVRTSGEHRIAATQAVVLLVTGLQDTLSTSTATIGPGSGALPLRENPYNMTVQRLCG